MGGEGEAYVPFVHKIPGARMPLPIPAGPLKSLSTQKEGVELS